MRKLALAAVFCLVLVFPTLSGCGAPAPVAAPPASDSPPGIAAQPQAQIGRGALDQAAALFGPAAAAAAAPEGERVLSAALVELLPAEPRTPRAGGSAAALLADPMSALNVAKNLALCHVLFAAFDQPTAAPTPAPTRPIYWLARNTTAAETAGVDRCPGRLAMYDYERAAHMHRLLGLASAGPFLVLERADPVGGERVAAVLDLTRARAEQIGAMVGYFRTALLGAEDAWAPARYRRERADATLTALFSGGQAARLVRASRDPGCAAERYLDRCETSE